MPDHTERPITFASRTLSLAEKNFSQLDKEGLGIVPGVKKFHQYVFGRHFMIYADHKPLISVWFNKSYLRGLTTSEHMLVTFTLGL